MFLDRKMFSLARRNPLLKIGFNSCGKCSVIFKPLRIINKKFISLGENVTFRERSRIEVIDSWNNKKYKSLLVIGDNTSFEQDAHIICAGNLSIGSNCVFSARVFITTANHTYLDINTNIMKQDLMLKDVNIGSFCFIGMDVKIFPGVTIGDNVIIGANSIVLHDIPSYSVVVGSPAKVIKKYDFTLRKWVSV